MEEVNLMRFLLAFLFVVGLIGAMGFGLRRLGRKQKWLGMQDAGGRIRVVEMRAIDYKRRLVLVRRDDREHLILLGEGRELVIESDIPAPEDRHA